MVPQGLTGCLRALVAAWSGPLEKVLGNQVSEGGVEDIADEVWNLGVDGGSLEAQSGHCVHPAGVVN